MSVERGTTSEAVVQAQEFGAFVELCPDSPGVAITVKDLIDLAGRTVRTGTPGLGHRKAGEDAEVWAVFAPPGMSRSDGRPFPSCPGRSGHRAVTIRGSRPRRGRAKRLVGGRGGPFIAAMRAIARAI